VATTPPSSARSGSNGGVPEARADRVAAIDIGSNSVRQIVADVASDGTIRVVDEMRAHPRLGAGLEDGGALDAEAMRAATDAVTHMVTLARRVGAARIEAVATSAVREATNAGEFIAMVRESTGLRLRVLTGPEEALLGFRSALAHFDLARGRAAVLDIGGGSLELALSVDGLLERLESFPFGALRLTERYLGEPIRRKHVRKLRKEVRDALRTGLRARQWRHAQLIGSGGTFTNLAGMVLARHDMTVAQSVHGTTVARSELEHILEALQEMTLEERREVPGLSASRADIIVAGLAVAAEVMARVDAPELSVSTYGIREGLLLETARVVPSPAAAGDARARSVQRLADACRFEELHSRHVQRLALQLFDAIGERLGASSEDRELLSDAALLHDIGYHISYDKHHKHSYYLILHAELLGMSPAEQVVVASVARYHRGTPPKKKHRNFEALDKELRARITRLAAILRLADGFDRGHIGAVERLKCRWTERALRITPVPANPGRSLRLELWGASRKSALLAKVAGTTVEIVAPDGSVSNWRTGDEPD
ncbi:MAG: Ppx/GppA family phosphatase, partial [Gemmatimonadota bacterium]|nr:Ppx/GppA family phosphatase [Gemmatimonadota bacterium]